MGKYEFTQDWFHWAPAVWQQLVPLLPERSESGRLFVEIGSFEGRSAVWIANNMMQDGDHLHCIDTWQGGEEHSAEDMAAVEARFDKNLSLLSAKFPAREFSKIKKPSLFALASEIFTGGEADTDFLYVDGSHRAKDVLTDACLAWPLLKKGGILVFDDYMWGEPRDLLHRPKLAIDAFVNIFSEEIEMVHVGYQLIVRKK